MKRNSLLLDSRGSIAILAAVLLPLAVMTMALAVNYGYSSARQIAVQQIADGAVLAAASARTKGTSDPAALRHIALERLAVGIASVDPDAGITDFSFEAVSGQPISIRGTVRAPLPVPGVFGQNTADLGFDAAAVADLGGYVQVQFFVDVSNSMSVPATDAALRTWKKYSGGCAFVCHDGTLTARGLGDNLASARKKRIPLKFDFVRRAMKSFGTAAGKVADAQRSRLRFGIFTVGTTFNAPLWMTDDLSQFSAAVDTLEVEPATTYGTPIGPAGGDGWSYLAEGMRMANYLTLDVGDGSSDNARRTIMVFITDGLDSRPPYRTFGPFYGPQCDALKARGIELFVLRTYYPEINDIGVDLALARADNVMPACATSPDHYIMADDGPAIEAAMSTIFDKVSRAIRLTN